MPHIIDMCPLELARTQQQVPINSCSTNATFQFVKTSPSFPARPGFHSPPQQCAPPGRQWLRSSLAAHEFDAVLDGSGHRIIPLAYGASDIRCSGAARRHAVPVAGQLRKPHARRAVQRNILVPQMHAPLHTPYSTLCQVHC